MFLNTHLHISCDVSIVWRFGDEIIKHIKKYAYVLCFVAFCFIWVMVDFTRIFQGYSCTIALMLLQRLWSWAWHKAWWRHQMETFAALLAICAGNSPVTGEFPSQRPVTRSFAVFFDLRLNKRLSKQSWGWWFETPPCSLWRHCKV